MERVRIDRWLCAARIFSSRTRAHEACGGGRVKIDGESVRPNRLVGAGDEIRVQAPGGLRLLRIRGLAEKRLSAALARELYEDRTPPELRAGARAARPLRDRGSGRPSKRERRNLQRFKRGPRDGS